MAGAQLPGGYPVEWLRVRQHGDLHVKGAGRVPFPGNGGGIDAGERIDILGHRIFGRGVASKRAFDREGLYGAEIVFLGSRYSSSR